MSGSVTVQCESVLQRPATPRNARWTFLVLPREASARLPTRGMATADVELGGHRFRATLQPDGRGGHWLKVSAAQREAAGLQVGDRVAVALRPAPEALEPQVPADLRRALAGAPDAAWQWSALTPAARRDWVQWLDSAKQAATRERRIASSCDMLAAGKRRVCCFDRSGIYSKAIAAPVAAD
jgi:hypothetical protein